MKNLSIRIRNRVFSGLLFAAILGLFFTSCSKEEAVEAMQQKNNVAFEATDAPIDNAEVEAVFITVSELHVDGKKVEGFNKTTMEISALTEGKTQLLKETSLENSSFSSVSLVLDYEADASGNFPGCYIKKKDGVKDQVKAEASKLELKKQVQLAANATTTVVLDFDLRKMIKEESNNYELVTKAELESSIRAAVKANTGTVEGKVNNLAPDGKCIAYVYKKGEFSMNKEVNGQGASQIKFANAVNSAEINSNGEFKLSFIEDGAYELHIFKYEDKDGKFELTSKVTLTSSNTIDLLGLNVDAKADVNLDINAIAYVNI